MVLLVIVGLAWWQFWPYDLNKIALSSLFVFRIYPVKAPKRILRKAGQCPDCGHWELKPVEIYKMTDRHGELLPEKQLCDYRVGMFATYKPLRTFQCQRCHELFFHEIPWGG